MGGIAIDLDDVDDPTHGRLFGNAKRLTLTAKGVALLAHCGLLPDISDEDIKDKNKTDSLAKLLACMQAGWMIVQVICRRALDLPTTLLEVHTVAHVVCALLLYATWWHKPRQVESPTLIRGDKIIPLAAYLYSASRMSGQRPRGILGRLLHPKPEMKKLAYLENQLSAPASPNAITTFQDATAKVAPALQGRFIPGPPDSTSSHTLEEELASTADDASMIRRKLAAEAVSLYPDLRSKFTQPKGEHQNPAQPAYLIPYAAELVQHHSLNWPNAGLIRRTQSLIMGMTLWGTSMAYGAIHISAWQYFFPTYAEKLLWHLSSGWVTFCAAFWLMIHLLAYYFPAIDNIWVAYNERRLGWLATGVITLLCILCGLSFVGSRAFLVLEAFVSIREVPSGVYDTPNWAQVFPHL